MVIAHVDTRCLGVDSDIVPSIPLAMVRITLEDPLEDPALGSPAHEVDDKRN